MRKSKLWSLAMALATTMSGASSMDNTNDDDSNAEEVFHFKPGDLVNKIEPDQLRYFTGKDETGGIDQML